MCRGKNGEGNRLAVLSMPLGRDADCESPMTAQGDSADDIVHGER